MDNVGRILFPCYLKSHRSRADFLPLPISNNTLNHGFFPSLLGCFPYDF